MGQRPSVIAVLLSLCLLAMVIAAGPVIRAQPQPGDNSSPLRNTAPDQDHHIFLPVAFRNHGAVSPTPTATRVGPTRTPTATATQVAPSPTPSLTPTATRLAGQIANGGFEQGRGVGWLEYNDRGAAVVRRGDSLNPPITPHGGDWLAALFANNASTTSQIGQSVTLGTGQSYLNLYYYIVSEELCDVPWYDNLRIYINRIPITDWNICRSNSTAGWTPGYLNLTGRGYLPGQTLSIVFEASSLSDGGMTVVYLDDISIDPEHN